LDFGLFWRPKPVAGKNIDTTGDRSMIEYLEPRKLFAGVSLHKGVLTVNGTEDSDLVQFQRERKTDVNPTGDVFFRDHLIVILNSEVIADFAFADIAKVKVNLKGGNDSCVVGRQALPFDISGGEGDDTISGGLKSDTLRGGAGRNILTGGKGNDHLICTAGGDLLTGGTGSDTADFSPFESSLIITLDDVANDAEEGAAGNVHSDIETIIGGGGADMISAENIFNPVSIFGGSGKDTILGGVRGDTIHGGPGNDSIHGQEGNDYINGDGGRDRVFGDDGIDTLNGGGPDPKFIPLPTPLPTDQDTVGGGTDGEVDTLNGGTDNDVVIFDPFDLPQNI
jgi:Ca2+-binding RTX toxin-like protein